MSDYCWCNIVENMQKKLKESQYTYIIPPSGFSFLCGFKRISVLMLILLVPLWPYPAAETNQKTPPYIKGIRADGLVEFISSEGKIVASISVEIADTPETRRRGLMWRTGIDDTVGMLFIFENVDYLSFWMRNTPTPLDIIFISEQGQIINIAADTVPMSTSGYTSQRPAKYVVEVMAGFCKRYGIVQGTQIQWQRH